MYFKAHAYLIDRTLRDFPTFFMTLTVKKTLLKTKEKEDNNVKNGFKKEENKQQIRNCTILLSDI